MSRVKIKLPENVKCGIGGLSQVSEGIFSVDTESSRMGRLSPDGVLSQKSQETKCS